jgi:hypothetical protein
MFPSRAQPQENIGNYVSVDGNLPHQVPDAQKTAVERLECHILYILHMMAFRTPSSSAQLILCAAVFEGSYD